MLGIAECEYPVQRCWIEHIGMHWIAGNSKVDEALSTDSSSIMSSPVPIALRMPLPSRMMIRVVTSESLIWLRVSVTDVWESGETTQGFPPHRCCSRPKEGHNDYPYRQTPHLETNSNEGFYVQQESYLGPTTSTHVNCQVLGKPKRSHSSRQPETNLEVR